MVKVKNPDGKIVEMPKRLSGREIKKKFSLPPNSNILTRIDKTSGQEELIKNADSVNLRDGDEFDSSPNFQRAYCKARSCHVDE